MTDRVGQAALDRALEDEEQLVLLYQPIHEARTGAIYGAEALLRQRRQSGELREASIIHETAEESRGTELFMLDNILVRKAYTDAARWQSFAPDIRLNVNLSPRELQEGDVVERLTALVTSCGIDARKVNIEITETAHIENLAAAKTTLRNLKDLDLGLWFDDFGTCHSAIDHLLHFPIDGIKLPGAFVKPLPADKKCRAITQNLIALAHDLGMAVIAEEVERQEQLDFLLEHSIDSIQGYLFSQPMTVEELERLARSAHPHSTDRGAARDL